MKSYLGLVPQYEKVHKKITEYLLFALSCPFYW